MAQDSGTGRGDNLRTPSSRKVAFAVGLLVAVLGGLFVSLAPIAGADTEANVPPISGAAAYATYPEAGIIPAGCTHDGAGVLVGINYAITHLGVTRNATVLNLEQLFIGDTVTMTWTDYAAGCEGVGISLAVKATDHNEFRLLDNQTLISYQYCSGADCGGTGTGFGGLTVQIPTKQAACNFQFDAVIGPPLQNVGPSGSYYTQQSRAEAGKANPTGPNMLIGYSNGGRGECIPPTATAGQSCTTETGPNVDVAVTNTDPNDSAIVDVLKNGTVVNGDVEVPIGQTVHSLVSFDVDETGTVSVNWTGSAGDVDPVVEIFSQEFTFDCVGLGATIVHECAEGGVVVDFTNIGSVASEMTVTKAGVVIDTVSVPGDGTAQRVYPMGEDETATYRVTGLGFDSGDQEFTHDCVDAESTTTTVPDTVQGTEVVRPTTLPRTGSDSTLPLSTMAGLLLMAGGLLLAAANRPVPTAAAANTRSRGR